MAATPKMAIFRMVRDDYGFYRVQQLMERWYGPRWVTRDTILDPRRFERTVSELTAPAEPEVECPLYIAHTFEEPKESA